MKGFAIGVAATAIALVLLAFVLPSVDYGGDIVGLILLAIVFGVVNGLIKPIVKLFSLPITVMTLGLFSIVINAGLLLFGTVDRLRAVRHRVHDRRLPDRRAVVRRPVLRARRRVRAVDHLDGRGARRPRLTIRGRGPRRSPPSPPTPCGAPPAGSGRPRT